MATKHFCDACDSEIKGFSNWLELTPASGFRTKRLLQLCDKCFAATEKALRAVLKKV